MMLDRNIELGFAGKVLAEYAQCRLKEYERNVAAEDALRKEVERLESELAALKALATVDARMVTHNRRVSGGPNAD